MLKRILLMLLLVTSVSGMMQAVETEGNASTTSEYVYVSTGSGAYAYHYFFDCQHLRQCVSEGHYKKVTEEEAQRAGRTPCKTCTKKKNKPKTR